LIKNIKIILIAAAIICFGYILISGEIKHAQGVSNFCKEQCNYDSTTQKWGLDLKWVFDEEDVESRIETKKSFLDKEFNQCISYCKDLEKELKYLTR